MFHSFPHLEQCRLLSMTEIRREQILEERAEEKQRLQNSRQIADLVRQQRSGTTNNEESVSRAAKRAFCSVLFVLGLS
jgi:RNA polymerase-associated protein RTF1